MNRREFMGLCGALGGVYAVGARVRAEEGPRRVGMLVGMGNDSEGEARLAAFTQALGRLGWTVGKNLQLDVRWASGDPNRIEAYGQELVASAPDVLVSGSLPVTASLQRRTRSIPIVFLVVPDPVRNGIVANQARPEGNVTGFATFEVSMGAKWYEVLREIAPDVARVGLLFDPTATGRARRYLSAIEDVARPFGTELENLAVHNEAEIEYAIARLARDARSGLIILPDNTTVRHRGLIASLAARHRLPAVYPYRYFAQSGGLVSYGLDTVDIYSQGATYVNRILRGAKPADLPVQESSKFEMVINLKAAGMLGLDIQPTLFARANEVIA